MRANGNMTYSGIIDLPKTTWTYRFGAALLIALTLALFLFTHGNPALAILPCLGVVLVAAVWYLPIRYTVFAVLFLGLLVDNPAERPGGGRWETPLLFPGRILFLPLEKTVMPGMKLFGIEFIVLLLALLIGLRKLTGDPKDGSNRVPANRLFVRLVLFSGLSLLLYFVWGLARGGASNFALMQSRYMLSIVCLTLLFSYTFKRPEDIPALLGIFISTAILRAIVGIYYWFTIARHIFVDSEGGDGSYVMTHSDSSLAVVAIIACVGAIYHHPCLRSFLVAAVALPPIFMGVVVNNRRVAIVDLVFGLILLFLLGVSRVKRRMLRTLLVISPLLLGYVGAAWNSNGAWAAPIRNLRSVTEQEDGSSEYRDIENFNLIMTAKQNPVVGSGFGHPFLEVIKLADISRSFEAYRYLPHNTVLWLISVGGVFGFNGFWMFLPVGIAIAAYLYRYAERTYEQLLAVSACTAVMCYFVQGFGDMGLSSMMSSLLVASSLGLSVSLATRHIKELRPKQIQKI